MSELKNSKVFLYLLPMVVLGAGCFNSGFAMDLGISTSGESSDALFNGDWDYIDQLIDNLDESGINSLRVGFSCHRYIDKVVIDEDPYFIGQLANFQEALSHFKDEGIEITLLLAYGSEYHYKDIENIAGCEVPYIFGPDEEYKRGFFPPEDSYWQQYIHDMLQRVGQDISGVEIWNEPNVIEGFFYGRIEDYIHLFLLAAEEVELYDPALPICTGGVTFNETFYKSYLRGLMDPVSGIYNQCDAVGLHFYHENALQGLRQYFEVCEELECTPKPVWVTEFARQVYEERGNWRTLVQR